MSQHVTHDKKFRRNFVRKGSLFVIVAAVTLEATSIIQFYFSRSGMTEEAGLRAESQLEATENRIMDVINQAETAIRNSVWIAQWSLDYPDSLMSVCRRIVEDNSVIMGSTVALVPGYLNKHPLFSPYVCEDADSLRFLSLATPDYDYPSHEWFKSALEAEHSDGTWSEPYIDEGGGEILMTTFSMPVKDYNGRIAAVITADISLDWLSELVGDIHLYPNAFSMVFSRSGQIMVSPINSSIEKMNIQDLEAIAYDSDTADIHRFSDAILSGATGNMVANVKGVRNMIYFDPVERTGWSLSIMIPEQEIFATLRRVEAIVKIFQILGLIMLILILRSFMRGQVKYKELNDKRERMEGELHIASQIQMTMIPKTFPPFPERHDLDIFAHLVPAKEVGGDLYDFLIRDEKLFFCIGDVSGKGVPAALVMSVTRSTFRSVSSHEDSPGKIVTVMNKALSDMNESSMFVTLFCGVLDLKNGHLRYSNAGHNPPFIFTDKIHPLPVDANLPLGIMTGVKFSEQEIPFHYDNAIFLYTDGITEAENAQHEQFGEERMIAVMDVRKGASEHVKALEDKVAEFVNGAPQSDDLTMLFIHFLGLGESAPLGNRLVMHNDINQIPRLEGWLEYLAGEFKFDEMLVPGLNLALEEAVTNVVMYAYPKGTYGYIDLSCSCEDGVLKFILSDSGTPFDPTKKPEVDISARVEERSIGGLGIHLVRQIMSSVSYEYKDGYNILTMIKNI